MEAVRKTIDSHWFELFGEEKRLYSYLTEGQSKLVVPSFVADVHKILYNKNTFQERLN